MVVRLRFGLRFVLGLVLRFDLAGLVLRFGDLGRRGAAVRLLDRAVLVLELGRVVDVLPRRRRSGTATRERERGRDDCQSRREHEDATPMIPSTRGAVVHHRLLRRQVTQATRFTRREGLDAVAGQPPALGAFDAGPLGPGSLLGGIPASRSLASASAG